MLYTLIRIVTFSAVVLLISSCMTERKAVNYLESKGQLPRICADLYPPVVTPGKPVTTTDTIYKEGPEIECPPSRIDTVTGKPYKVFVKCPPNVFVHDTTTLHDTIVNNARIVAQGREIDSFKLALGITVASRDKARKQANTRLFIIIGVGLFGIAVLIIKLKNDLI